MTQLVLVVAVLFLAAGWALVHFWPVSVPVWVLGAVLFWGVAIASAQDEPA